MIGIDVGGTFTDIITMNKKGEILTAKLPTNPDNRELAVIEGASIFASESDPILNHASTAGLNAILTRNLPKIGFLTTIGHRDILDMARAWRPMEEQTNPLWRRGCGDASSPFVDRYLRRGIQERITSKGEILIPLDEKQARAEINVFKNCDVKGIAICLINAYINGNHEQKLRDLICEIMGETFPVSISCDVSPLAKEYERASTTVIDVYMKIVFGKYLNKVTEGVSKFGFSGNLNIADSAADLVPFEFAMKKPSRIMYSGPAAGIKASTHFGELIDESEIICCDIGGTTSDIGLIKSGKPTVKATFEVEHDVIVNTLAIQIWSIGQGGGTIAHVNSAGELLVGPQSAGSDPGPACYGKGGQQPTITDACLLSGILRTEAFLGGEMSLYPDLSRQTFDQLATNTELAEKVRQVYELGLHNIAEGILGVTVERGIDPRDYALFAYGSAGPMLVPQLMERLGVGKVIIPPFPGVYSALGLASTDMVYSESKSAYIELESHQKTAEKINHVFSTMEESLMQQINPKDREHVQVVRSFDGWYEGQTWETPFIPAPLETITEESIDTMLSNFHVGYQEMWGNMFPFLPVIATTYRTMLVLPTPKLEYPQLPRRKKGKMIGQQKKLQYISDSQLTINEYQRDTLLHGDEIEGPAIIREPKCTIMVCSGQSARVGKYGEIHIERRI